VVVLRFTTQFAELWGWKMPDKIIIDGVDVAGCKAYFYDSLQHVNRCVDSHSEIKCECAFYPNCYYKQLQRKEQQLKTSKEAYELCLVNKENRHKKEVNRYKQALDRIKKTATDLRTRRDYHSPDEVNADIDKILTITNEVKDE